MRDSPTPQSFSKTICFFSYTPQTHYCICMQMMKDSTLHGPILQFFVTQLSAKFLNFFHNRYTSEQYAWSPQLLWDTLIPMRPK